MACGTHFSYRNKYCKGQLGIGLYCYYTSSSYDDEGYRYTCLTCGSEFCVYPHRDCKRIKLDGKHPLSCPACGIHLSRWFNALPKRYRLAERYPQMKRDTYRDLPMWKLEQAYKSPFEDDKDKPLEWERCSWCSSCGETRVDALKLLRHLIKEEGMYWHYRLVFNGKVCNV